VRGVYLSGFATTGYQKFSTGMTVEWDIHCHGSKIWKPVKYRHAKGKEF